VLALQMLRIQLCSGTLAGSGCRARGEVVSGADRGRMVAAGSQQGQRQDQAEGAFHGSLLG